MFHCPVCEKRTIPAWYPLVPQFLLKPHRCTSCGTALVARRWWGESVAYLPALVLGLTVPYSDAQPWFIVLVFWMAWVMAMSLWVHTIRFKEAPKPTVEQFEPHTNRLPW